MNGPRARVAASPLEDFIASRLPACSRGGGERVLLVDPHFSYLDLARAIGGQVITLGRDPRLIDVVDVSAAAPPALPAPRPWRT